MNVTAEPQHERSEYRIVYPRSIRPQLRRGTEVFQVADVSEHGVRVLEPQGTMREIGDRFEGQLPLVHGPEVPIRGRIVRRFDDGFAIEFDEDAHIILLHIIGEQRHLRELFADFR